MSSYFGAIRRWKNKAEKVRALSRLLALRQVLAPVRAKKRPGTLMLATWNIRDFDSNKFGHGPRLRESFHYIAEVVSSFDLIAIQEVNRDLSALKKLMRLLGPSWDYIVTDATEGASGNAERMAFVFDTGTVSFAHVAGEIVLPKGQKIVSRKQMASGEDTAEQLQFARTPFMVAFQAGWFRFNLSTVHIYYGAVSGEKLERRKREIAAIARFFKKRQQRDKQDTILLGDFNIVAPDHGTMKALTDNGFTLPDGLSPHATNLDGTKYYDQIALCVREHRLEIGDCGAVEIFDAVFRDNDEDFDAYQSAFPAKFKTGSRAAQQRYYADKWRTFQMSDHKPLWLELKTDFADAYLQERLKDTAG